MGHVIHVHVSIDYMYMYFFYYFSRELLNCESTLASIYCQSALLCLHSLSSSLPFPLHFTLLSQHYFSQPSVEGVCFSTSPSLSLSLSLPSFLYSLSLLFWPTSAREGAVVMVMGSFRGCPLVGGKVEQRGVDSGWREWAWRVFDPGGEGGNWCSLSRSSFYGNSISSCLTRK